MCCKAGRVTDSVISRSAACDHEQAYGDHDVEKGHDVVRTEESDEAQSSRFATRYSNLTIPWIQDVRHADIDSMARVLSPLVSQYTSVHKEMLKLSFEEEWAVGPLGILLISFTVLWKDHIKLRTFDT